MEDKILVKVDMSDLLWKISTLRDWTLKVGYAMLITIISMNKWNVYSTPHVIVEASLLFPCQLHIFLRMLGRTNLDKLLYDIFISLSTTVFTYIKAQVVGTRVGKKVVHNKGTMTTDEPLLSCPGKY